MSCYVLLSLVFGGCCQMLLWHLFSVCILSSDLINLSQPITQIPTDQSNTIRPNITMLTSLCNLDLSASPFSISWVIRNT